jgi:hypothetical protein
MRNIIDGGEEMNLDKIYHDLRGLECNILTLVKREPEWAANRIQEGERAIEELTKANAPCTCPNCGAVFVSAVLSEKEGKI